MLRKRQWGRYKQTGYRSFHVHDAVTHAQLRLRLAQIGALFGSQNAIFVKHKMINISVNIYLAPALGMLIDHV